MSDSEVKNVIREVKKIDNNESFLKVLRDGINIKNSATGRMHDYKLLDFDNGIIISLLLPINSILKEIQKISVLTF